MVSDASFTYCMTDRVSGLIPIIRSHNLFFNFYKSKIGKDGK